LGERALTLPSRGRPQAGFAHLRPPLMSNVRARTAETKMLGVEPPRTLKLRPAPAFGWGRRPHPLSPKELRPLRRGAARHSGRSLVAQAARENLHSASGNVGAQFDGPASESASSGRATLGALMVVEANLALSNELLKQPSPKGPAHVAASSLRIGPAGYRSAWAAGL
jgi:hypothetical protein